MTATEYLKEHGINSSTAESFELTHDDNFLNIPIKDYKGNDLFTKSRNLNYPDNDQPKYKNEQGGHATLFNYFAVAEADTVIITEGEMDAIKLTQEGFPAVSSTSGSGSFPDEFIPLLENKKIYICYDNDEPGTKGTNNVIEKLPNAKIIQLPPMTKDVCNFFANANVSAKDFFKLMKNALTRINWQVKQHSKDYRVMGGAELMAKEFPKMPWIIDSIIYKQGFSFIYGAEGIGKSFLALSIAKAVAEGSPWLGKFNVPEPINVLYLDKENPHSLMQKRSKGLGGIPDNLYWLESPAKFQLHDGKGNESDFAVALSEVVEQKNIGLIIIDSFVDLMVGNESSAGDTQVFFDGLRVLYPDIAYLVLHHENKPAAATFRTPGQRLRGSTNINAQAFTMFRLEAIAKSKIDLTLQQTKARDEQKMDKFMIRMLVENNPEEEGKTIVTGFEYVGVVATDNDDKSAEAEEAINEALAEAPNNSISRKELMELLGASGISLRTSERTLKIMVDSETIQKYRNGKSIFYRINGPIVDEFDVIKSFM